MTAPAGPKPVFLSFNRIFRSPMLLGCGTADLSFRRDMSDDETVRATREAAVCHESDILPKPLRQR
jgi:hypothetical protein